jgi:hypothetical protein
MSEPIPLAEVLESNGEGVGKSGWFIKTSDGSHYQVDKKDYLISKRDLTTHIKAMIEQGASKRNTRPLNEIAWSCLPIQFVDAMEENHPEVYSNLYDHLTGWDFKGGAAKVPRVEGGADKGVDFLVTTLRDFAPVMSPEELKAGLRTLVNDDFKMEVATTKLKALLEKNGRDGINKDQFIMLRAKNTEGKKK